MVCIGGSIGKVAICNQTMAFNQQINAIHPEECVPEFVYAALLADHFQVEVLRRATGSATPIINKGKWSSIPIPVPPLAEQRRIVAKVDQLMSLVDQLESQLKQSRTTAESLMDAVVATLVV